jgi:RNA polymerase sigma-54 factor
MKQSLQLRLGQQITMTPQLQQAIRLLQLSTLDLQMEIQQALESNMMLEEGEETHEVELSEEQKKEASGESETSTEVQLEKTENLPEELDTDSSWEDTYGQDYSDFGHSDYPTGDSEYRDIAVHSSPAPTLYDHLIWQLDLTPFSDTDRAIALTIIDGIDADGYLKSSLEDILLSVNSGEKEEDEEHVLLEEVETVLRRLQHFDPIGVGARDLGECLLLQLAELDKTTPWLKEAQLLVKEHLSLLAVHDYTQLLKRMKMNRQDLQEVVALIQSLHPMSLIHS